MVVSSEQIKKDVVDQLYWDDMVDASRVFVDVSDGQVILTGSVPTFSARLAAEADASVVPGVKSVRNELSINPPAALPMPSDEEIRHRVESILSWSSDIDVTSIKVKVTNGAVELDGSTDSFWKKLRIVDLVSSVAGITEVMDHLAVVPTEDIADRVIADELVGALDRSTMLDASGIKIKVQNGVVTLSGTVANWVESLAAIRIARNTSGVRDVVNDLDIEFAPG